MDMVKMEYVQAENGRRYALTMLARLFFMLFHLHPEYFNWEIPASNPVSFTCIHTVGIQLNA